MLLPTVTNLSRAGAPRAVSTLERTPAPALARPPAPPVALPVSQNAGARDLTAELAERLKQDLDYQILRKSFALDDDRDSASAQRVAGSAIGQAERETTLAMNLGDTSRTAANGAAASSLSTESTTRLELSMTSSDSGLTLQYQRVQSQSVQLNLRLNGGAPAPTAVQMGDPLVLDLSGKGIVTTGVEAGVAFDLTGDGQLEQVSFVTGDSWFLALDRNDNGQIDNGRELFGDQHGAAHGFAELARHDDHADGVIDARDEAFSRLRLFQIGSDGAAQVKTLADAGVTAIELGYQTTRKALNVYDNVAQIGQFRRTDGSTGEASDVLLGYRDLA